MVSVNHGLPLVHFSHFLQQTLTGGGLFLLAHDAGLFVVLALLHFGKNTGLFHLLLETAKRDVEAVVVIVKIYSGQNNHLPMRKYKAREQFSRAAKKSIRIGKKCKHFILLGYSSFFTATPYFFSTARRMFGIFAGEFHSSQILEKLHAVLPEAL